MYYVLREKNKTKKIDAESADWSNCKLKFKQNPRTPGHKSAGSYLVLVSQTILCKLLLFILVKSLRFSGFEVEICYESLGYDNSSVLCHYTTFPVLWFAFTPSAKTFAIWGLRRRWQRFAHCWLLFFFSCWFLQAALSRQHATRPAFDLRLHSTLLLR